MKPTSLFYVALTLIFTSGGCERELTRSPGPTHDVAVTKVSVPSSCVQGDTVRVVVGVENRCNPTEGIEVVLTDVTEGKQIGRKLLTLSAAGQGGMDEVADLILTGETAGSDFGSWLATGDVNRDGYDDLLVSANAYNDLQGRAYLFFGGENMANAPDRIFTGEKTGDVFSGGGGCLADMNNDGFDDVIIGARHFGNTGRVYLFWGGPDMDEKADLVFEPEKGVMNSWFGRGLAVGDVNGDGYKDLIVSAPGLQSDNRGRVYLFFGGDPLDTSADRIFVGERPGDGFGAVRSARGDVDGDGCDDLLIGTRYYPDSKSIGRGRAYLYYGAPGTDMDTVCDVTFNAENDNDEFATGVDLFDIDNDGHADVIFSARRWFGGTAQGKVYLYWGSGRAAMDNVADVTFTGEADASATLGGDHVVAGYVNDDEYGDIIVTAYDYYGRSGHSRTYLLYGNTKSSIDNLFDQAFTGVGPGNFIMDARTADFNRDGSGDIAVGGWAYPNWTRQGRVWLYYGTHPSSTDVQFTWDTASASIGDHILSVTLSPVAGKAVRNIKTMTVSVKPAAPDRREKPHQEKLQKSPARSTTSQETAVPPSERPTKSLTGAAVDGDMHHVELHLAGGTDINEKTISGDTALHYAIKYRHGEVAELLIARGADINSRNRDGETPVHLAIKADQKKVVDLLITKGASVSPPHLAAYRGDLAAVRESIKKKVSVNTQDEGGLTLLHAAASGGQKEVVAYLLERGAKVNPCDKKKQMPLFCAAAAGHKDVVQLLIDKGANPNPARDPDRWTPLYAAVSASHRDVVETLLSKGGDANAKALTGDTPLHVATLKGDRDMAALLIDNGAGLNAANARSANTPLHLAVTSGQRDIVELLATKGADLNAKNSDGFTPLHYAVSARRLSFWETQIGDSSTPNDLAIAQLLVTHGADVNAKSNDGATPLSLALKGGPAEIVDLLRKHGAKE